MLFSKSIGVSLMVLGLTACGMSQKPKQIPNAVGYKTALGQTLTKSHWCTTPTTDGANPSTFVELEVRQHGYVKTFYSVKPDNALQKASVERGTWAVVGDQFYTTPKYSAQTHQRLSVNRATKVDADEPTDHAATARVTKTDAAETCISLTDANDGQQNYCSCTTN